MEAQTAGAVLLKMQFSFLLMVLGARCNQLAVAWWALQETGSALYFANMIACSIAAEVLAKPLLGWLGDKYNKILMIKLASWISLLTALLMVVLSAAGSLNPWTVGALMMISSAIVGVRDPLQASIIALFADDEKVSLSFRTKSVMSSFSILLGPLLASGRFESARHRQIFCSQYYDDMASSTPTAMGLSSLMPR